MARKKLQGQIAIITGGGRGIGAASAIRLAEAGAAVVLNARSEEEIEKVAETIKRSGGRAIAVPGDISDREAVEELVESAVEQFGRVDIVVNNAAVLWPIDEVRDADPDEWAYNIHVNLIGPFYLANNVLPLMLEQGYGRIINVSSGSSRNAVAGASAYLAAKAGLDVFTRILAKELASSGSNITVNSLYPGHVDTLMQADLRSIDGADSSLDFSKWHELYQRGELLAPQAVAQAIYWLVGTWSRQYNGELFDFTDLAWRTSVETDVKG